jgi:hypothetical protein
MQRPDRQYSSEYADTWMKKLETFHSNVMDPVLDAMESSSNDSSPNCSQAWMRKTRVAIIDTGICWREPYIAGARERIKAARNWVPRADGIIDDQDVDDKFGHGTQTASLLLKVAPGIDLYIARVSEDGLVDDESFVADVSHLGMPRHTREERVNE